MSRSVYLDHAATTPMRPDAIEAMAATMAQTGNAASLHGAGRDARRRVEESRESIAAALGARPSEVIFTAGGTESDNLAVKGSTGPAAALTRAVDASLPAPWSTTPCWMPCSGSSITRAPR